MRLGKHCRVRWLTAAVLSLSWLAVANAALTRVAESTLQLPAIPSSPSKGYSFTNALGALTFDNPVAIVSPPGETNRLFIVEKAGRVIVITNLTAPTRTVFLDLTDRVWTPGLVFSEEGLLGMAFHPGYATNHLFYLFYTGIVDEALHDILARFEMSPADRNLGLAESEVRLLTQADPWDGHCAGDLRFGPDGYLYVALGDGGWDFPTAAIENGQRIDHNFFSGILRLDVDNRPESLSRNPHPAAKALYSIPPDNPFIGAATFNGLPVNPSKVRTEFWAVGLRNPWRMSFDSVTGNLYCGDAGVWFEEINLITRGGNYGWPYWNGFDWFTEFPQENIPIGSTPIHATPLLAEPWQPPYLAVIGGVVYRGQRMPELYGAYIFGHWGGEVRALRHSGTNVTENTELVWMPTITAFGVDPSNGDILVANAGTGSDATIDRLIYNEGGEPMPPTLADTGAFADLVTLTPQDGIVPYEINVPFWSDLAHKTRWFSLPQPAEVVGFEREENWTFPSGTVWIKHFELELTNGMAASRRRLETRFLVKNDTGIYGATYRWGDSLTNATLVPEDGMDETFVIDEGGGFLRTQVWHYPGRTECLSCHTAAGGYALGFNTAQLNRDFNYEGLSTNQLAALSQAGYFDAPISNRHTLPALSDLTNTAVSLSHRVRSYLAANCASCHQPAGTARGYWDARISVPASQAGLINGPLFDDLGDPENRVIAPGSPDNSVLLKRLAEFGQIHMPPLATSLLNTQAIAMISAWITNDLPAQQSYTDWQWHYFGTTNDAAAAEFADPDDDHSPNYLEYLTGTSPTNALDVWNIAISLSNGVPVVEFEQRAHRGFEVQSAWNLADNSWTPLNTPANAPLFSATNRLARVPDPTADFGLKYYRVRVFEP